MSLNSVVVVGRVVHTPEVKHLASGDAVANLTVALNEKVKGEDRAHFFDCVIFGKSAEACGKHLTKGDMIGVSGKLQQERWETKEGQKRSKIVIRVWNIDFLKVAAWDRGGDSQTTEFRPEDENQAAGLDEEDSLPF